ncbi:MAG TPA: endonuclease/exonuclease/phosphatase family protein [Acidiferrobacteraceae bacterium]|nr:endonuclease/exonuclease/phosphatase family protein [Acidiferrobacteraceae bacterium]
MGFQFTVASYNIHGCVGKDRSRNADRISQVIREFDADIVGLQEVDSHGLEDVHRQMDYLPAATGYKAIAGPVMQRTFGDYGNLLLTNHPILDVRRIDLSVAGYEPRGALDVDLEIKDHAVRVVVTHFGLRATERQQQAQKLLRALAPTPGQTLVVMGDFNEWFPLSRSLGWLNARLGHAPAPRTYPAFLPLLPLDRVWVSPAHALVEIHAHVTGVTQVCSDHLPLKATISL